MQKNEPSKRKFEEINSETSRSDLVGQSRTSSTYGAEEHEDFYEVEEIVGKKTCRGKCLYQVKWVGYPSDQNTWEPFENLKNVEYLIEEFEKVNEELKRKKKSKKQPESKEEKIEKVMEKYKDYGLNDLMKNNIAPNRNKSRDITRSTDENEEKSFNKSLNTSSANEGLRNESSLEEITDKIKKKELMGDINYDKPLLIKFAKWRTDKIRFLVKWEKRENGLEPFDSWVDHESIKKLYPYILIDFYESRLKRGSQDNNESRENEN